MCFLDFSQLQKFRDELKNRSRVLKKLGHIDGDGVVQLKGRAASLIDTGDELLVTELMFNGKCFVVSPILETFRISKILDWSDNLSMCRSGCLGGLSGCLHYHTMLYFSAYIGETIWSKLMNSDFEKTNGYFERKE